MLSHACLITMSYSEKHVSCFFPNRRFCLFVFYSELVQYEATVLTVEFGFNLIHRPRSGAHDETLYSVDHGEWFCAYECRTKQCEQF